MNLPIEIEKHMPEIEAEIASTGAELIELQYRRAGSRGFLTFLVDKAGGITLDGCVQVNRKLSALFDGYEQNEPQGFFQTPYSLEVNSPGLDRPMKNEKDFRRALGERVRIWTTDTRMWTARIQEVTGDGVSLEEKNGKMLSFRWDEIVKAIRDL